jgi:hypothetical protein
VAPGGEVDERGRIGGDQVDDCSRGHPLQTGAKFDEQLAAGFVAAIDHLRVQAYLLQGGASRDKPNATNRR